tara:strand:+ start:1049 stop:3190 length:2142 start_codon:yes stop_codon:yes gene_type:complete
MLTLAFHTLHIFKLLAQLPQAFVRQSFVPIETTLRVYRRYIRFEPGHTEEYIEILKSRNLWDEAAKHLADVLNDDAFHSLSGKSSHQLWLELCEMLTKHAARVQTINVDAIVRGGIHTFSDEAGKLWTALADFYIRRGMFDTACDIYEEAMASVVTVRDFSLIYDAYTKFEESMLSAKMRDDIHQCTEASETKHSGSNENDFLLTDTGEDLELRLARLDFLIGRRPELLSSVLLRQNPHDVIEWQKRVSIFEGNPRRQVFTFTEAVKTVDPSRALGRYHMLWIDFARFYERHGDFANARIVFKKAVNAPFFKVDDLATVWCEWAEFEIRQKDFSCALALLQQATTEPAQQLDANLDFMNHTRMLMRDRLYKSPKLWTFYCDLQESIGSFNSARACYNRMIDLHIASPQTILNFAAYLQENDRLEDSFQVYERGVSLFKFPHSREIWQTYLIQFVTRFGASKLERSRDLFEQCCTVAPPEDVKPFFIEYARMEEDFGAASRAMDIYKRACFKVPVDQKLDLYRTYISCAMRFFGPKMVRSIYDFVIAQTLPGDVIKVLCMQYAHFERKFGEIDRARALYTHACQIANPQEDAELWDEWNALEVQNGNEDTFREMLRIKRSVCTSLGQVHFNTVEIEPPSEPMLIKSQASCAVTQREEDDMTEMTKSRDGLNPANDTSSGHLKLKLDLNRLVSAKSNPDEIDIDANELCLDGGKF